MKDDKELVVLCWWSLLLTICSTCGWNCCISICEERIEAWSSRQIYCGCESRMRVHVEANKWHRDSFHSRELTLVVEERCIENRHHNRPHLTLRRCCWCCFCRFFLQLWRCFRLLQHSSLQWYLVLYKSLSRKCEDATDSNVGDTTTVLRRGTRSLCCCGRWQCVYSFAQQADVILAPISLVKWPNQ